MLKGAEHDGFPKQNSAAYPLVKSGGKRTGRDFVNVMFQMQCVLATGCWGGVYACLLRKES